jgi:hypothetical protein
MKTPKFLIDVGFQRDGYTFRLDPRSRVWLEETYPDLPRVASIFIGFDQHHDLQQIPQSIWNQIIQLLTGLSFQEINTIGGFVVTNPQTEQEVFNSLMVYV